MGTATPRPPLPLLQHAQHSTTPVLWATGRNSHRNESWQLISHYMIFEAVSQVRLHFYVSVLS